MNNYNTTFDNRLKTFSYAQLTYQNVMKYEFETALELCSPILGNTFVNIPADIVFPKQLLPENVTYIPFEFNKKFADKLNCVNCSIDNIPISEHSVDTILSLAGLHHFSSEDRLKFYKECKRILKPQVGVLIIGEVLKGSKQDKWLNEYVHSNNSNGHEGMFLTEDEKLLLESVGFKVEIIHKEYPWIFDSISEMCDYCINLFGLDKVNHEKITQDISKYLNYTVNEDGSCQFIWSLIYFKSTICQV